MRHVSAEVRPSGSARRAVSFSERCRQHALANPSRAALIYVSEDGKETATSWEALDRWADRAARLFRDAGVDRESLVVIAIPDGAEHYVAALAAWRLGACTLPLNPAMPAAERKAVLELASSWRPIALVGDWHVAGVATIQLQLLSNDGGGREEVIRDVVPCPGKAIGSGGSTGRPKIIVDPKPWAHIPGCWGPMSEVGLGHGQRQLVTSRLYHNVGFFLSHIGLFEGHTLVFSARFDAARTVELIRKHHIQFLGMLPIMMQRIARLPGLSADDFSSVEAMYHAGAACPDWVKRRWLELVSPERLWEIYGSTEEKGMTMLRGDEWLRRPGSVGRPYRSEIRIQDRHGRELRRGEVGEIYMRNAVDTATPTGGTWPQEPTCEYVGAPAPETTEDGFVSVGDMGRLDEDGFLYLADRRVDMIVSGGVNVYPAEIESVLSAHPDVADVVVIGVADAQWGHRVHALIQPADWPHSLDVGELDRFCRGRLLAYKVPKSYELMQALPRDPSGKIRRTALREERRAGWTAAMIVARRTEKASTDANAAE